MSIVTGSQLCDFMMHNRKLYAAFDGVGANFSSSRLFFSCSPSTANFNFGSLVPSVATFHVSTHLVLRIRLSRSQITYLLTNSTTLNMFHPSSSSLHNIRKMSWLSFHSATPTNSVCCIKFGSDEGIGFPNIVINLFRLFDLSLFVTVTGVSLTNSGSWINDSLEVHPPYVFHSSCLAAYDCASKSVIYNCVDDTSLAFQSSSILISCHFVHFVSPFPLPSWLLLS